MTQLTLEDAPPWQTALKNLVTEPEDLLKRLALDDKWLKPARSAAALFPLKVTESFVRRMRPGDPKDPLLLQVLPLQAEHHIVEGYTADPLEETKANPLPGLIHKYHGRVLLIAATHCAIHCRYCFRRHFPYEDNRPSRKEWDNALDYIRGQPDIHEVILSGGDPMALSDRHLIWLCEQLAGIAHIKTVRIHTRLPVILPERITDTLTKSFATSRLQFVCVVHSNHAQELDHAVEEALTRLKKANVHLLNQSVLLRGINDSPEALIELSHTLFNMGVLPYYLHAMDRVAGAAHFDVSENETKALMARLRDSLPGYLVPKWVKEEPSAASKTLLAY